MLSLLKLNSNNKEDIRWNTLSGGCLSQHVASNCTRYFSIERRKQQFEHDPRCSALPVRALGCSGPSGWVLRDKSAARASHGYLTAELGLNAANACKVFKPLAKFSSPPRDKYLVYRRWIMSKSGDGTESVRLYFFFFFLIFKRTTWTDAQFPDLWSAHPVPDSIMWFNPHSNRNR